MDDHALLKNYTQTKSRDTFIKIVDRYTSFVYAVCLRRLHDHHQAEDATQAVFIILSQKTAKIPKHTPLGAWLFTTARNISYTALREQKKQQKIREAVMKQHFEEDQREQAVVWEQIRPSLDQCLENLSVKLRNVIVLYYLNGLTQQEVAHHLQIAESTVRQRLKKGLVRLQKSFAKNGIKVTPVLIGSAMASSAGTAQAAPPSLAATVCSSVSTYQISAQTTASVGTMLTSFSNMLVWYKVKLAATAAVCLLTVTGMANMLRSESSQPKDTEKPVISSKKTSLPDSSKETRYGQLT